MARLSAALFGNAVLAGALREAIAAALGKPYAWHPAPGAAWLVEMSDSPNLRGHVEPDPVRLTERLMACARRWEIQTGDALAGGFRSHVFAATRADGMEVVVKLVDVPGDAEAEVTALSAWAASGATLALID